MTVSLDKTRLAQCQTKLSGAYRIILSDFNKGKEVSEQDRYSLAIEVKAAYPEFNALDISRVLQLPEEDFESINEAAATRTIERQKEKALEKAKAKSIKKETVASNQKLVWVDKNEDGFPKLTPDNVEIALAHLGINVRRNLFSSRFEITGLEAEGWTHLNDLCVDWLKFRLEKPGIGLFTTSSDSLDRAIKQVAHKNRYHPVKDYIESITWDGVERLSTWLIDLAGVVDNEYTRAVSALTLMAAVKRVYEPGCVFHEMLILQSAQGWGKSGAMKALCPNPDWFSDDLPLGADAKIVMECTSGKWIIEAAEMQNFKKTNHNQMKAFMSRSSDRARMAFEKNPSEVYRQFIIIGTVNEDEFLSDPTGDRRYWPVAMGRAIDENVVREIRDQLWAEAYHRVIHLGQSIRLDKNLWALAEKSRQQFTVNNPFHEDLVFVLSGLTGRITNATLYKIFDIHVTQRIGHAKLKKAMEDLGWKQEEAPVRKGGTTVRCWSRGGSKEWLEPVRDSKTGRWYLKPDRPSVGNDKFDDMTQGLLNDLDDEFDSYDPEKDKPN